MRSPTVFVVVLVVVVLVLVMVVVVAAAMQEPCGLVNVLRPVTRGVSCAHAFCLMKCCYWPPPCCCPLPRCPACMLVCCVCG